MTVNYNLTTRNNRLTQVGNNIDAGSAAGVLRLLDGSGNILSSLPLAKPSVAVSGGVAAFQGLSLTDPSAAMTGLATAARVEDSTGTVVISGLTVGVAGSTSDILLSPSNNIGAGQVVSITAAQITGN